MVGTSVPPPGYVDATDGDRPLAPRAQAPAPPGSRGRLKLLTGAAAVACLAGVVFVLFGSTSSQLTDPVARAATLSSSTAGYRMQMSIEMSSPQLGSPITATGGGVVDLRDRAASLALTMDLSAIPQASQVLGSSTMRMEMITDGTALYMRFPASVMTSLPTSGKRWLKIDVGKLAGVPGLSSLQSNPAASDPSQLLQYLRSASNSVVSEGRQRVDGVQTTHYHAELSFDRLADSLPSAERSHLQQELSQLRQAAQTQDFPIDVWIDAHHLVRRVVMSIDLHVSGGSLMHEAVTMDIGHYGPQPRPVTPPSDEVQDLSALANVGRGSATP